ncbi:hypothetical protein ACH5RR_023344 [Cinchona calisaya]|uniref:Reverse transcriptase domain-containing protein n=1 Tax=Cinchona calisaya TaxID=153742 RepID=A0ABD2ZDJ1_9GENT
MEACNGTTDPCDHLGYFDFFLAIHGVADDLRCLMPPIAFRGEARKWNLELPCDSASVKVTDDRSKGFKEPYKDWDDKEIEDLVKKCGEMKVEKQPS